MATTYLDRFNNTFGRLGTSLTTSTTGTVATFFSSNWPHATTAATHFLRITLTPTTPTEEIIHGQATNGAKTFTITARAQETTSAVAHAKTQKWVNAPTAATFTGITTTPPGIATTIITTVTGSVTTGHPPTITVLTAGKWHNTSPKNVFVVWNCAIWLLTIAGMGTATPVPEASITSYLSKTVTTLFAAHHAASSQNYGKAIGTAFKTASATVTDSSWTLDMPFSLMVPGGYWVGWKVLNAGINKLVSYPV